MSRKSLKELNLSNFFLFSAVMEEEELCRGMLERILGTPLAPLKIRIEKVEKWNLQNRGIQLDLEAENPQYMINAEMQNKDKHILPKRSRYHQSLKDVNYLQSGRPFTSLKDSVIIFICTFDPGDKNKFRYEFTYKDEESDPLMDGTRKIFLNTKGKNEKEISRDLKNLLEYIQTSTDETADRMKEDIYIQALHRKVKEIQSRDDQEVRYMYLYELIEDEREEALQEGLQEGRRELSALVAVLLKNGDYVSLEQMTKDPLYQEELLRKYHLK